MIMSSVAGLSLDFSTGLICVRLLKKYFTEVLWCSEWVSIRVLTIQIISDDRNDLRTVVDTYIDVIV